MNSRIQKPEAAVSCRIRGLDVYRVGRDGKERHAYKLSLLARADQVPHDSLSLDLVAFSDYRIQSLDRLLEFLAARKHTDVVLYAGDDVRRFRSGGKNWFEALARHSRYGVCAVAGNDDDPSVRDLIAGVMVYPVHTKALVVGRFAIVGIEAAPVFPSDFGTKMNIGCLLYPEHVIAAHLKRWSRFADKRLIVVSHAPPYGVLDFAVRFGPRNIGSRPLKEFLDKTTNALLCVCGHVHRCGGQAEPLGRCMVVNAASHDRPGDPGKVASITIRRGVVKSIEWHTLS